MGIAKSFSGELLVVGVLLSHGMDGGAVLDALASEFGPIAEASPEASFAWTRYYDAEMGEGIRRLYLLFSTPVDPSELAGIKTKTNRIEASLSEGGLRRANLDPGLLAPGRFVLATTKDRAHRIALRDGIYAELTLIYERGSFRSLPWTYPDWASPPVVELLGRWRRLLFGAKG